MFGSKKKKRVFYLEHNNEAAIMVSPAGKITGANQVFLTKFKFNQDEVVGQNIHILIPPKFMKKSAHDKLMSRYSYGKNSPIVGAIRTLPLKNGDDEDIFMKIQIFPFTTTGKTDDFEFMCMFHEIPINRVLVNDKTQSVLQNELIKTGRTQDFLEMTPALEPAIEQVKIFNNWEINLLVSFIYQNRSNKRLSEMVRYFVLVAPLGHLDETRQFFLRNFENPEYAFLNVIVLQILFPVLINNFKSVSVCLQTLKENLYKDTVSGDSSGNSVAAASNHAK